MDYSRYAASVKAGVFEVACLEITHSLITPIRRAMWPTDWVATISGTPTTFTNAIDAGGWDSAKPKMDSSGRATRSLRLNDVDLACLTAFNALKGSVEMAVCTIRLYLFDIASPTDFTNLQITEIYTVETYSPDGTGILNLSVGTQDVGNQRAPRPQHTLANTPGLRGR